ncbi:hypothetical protein WS72_04275 [Burkholderia savannae]|uniref:Uncharacterized protein n=1 Tax=Burkholderia savannae TaxID=1637837 RepID=A0ABR5TAY9_9BURK|nr:hypothetical protein WS72_04275 [Burkholderia savannae]
MPVGRRARLESRRRAASIPLFTEVSYHTRLPVGLRAFECRSAGVRDSHRAAARRTFALFRTCRECRASRAIIGPVRHA